ncbi:hypothetical protein P5V15_009540 [Pogonomyrmex californicus]
MIHCCDRAKKRKHFPEMCARVKCDHEAHCVAGVCVCPKVCPESSGELVCGSDAKTYQSECELQRAACGRDPKLPALHVTFYGDCTDRLAAAALSTFPKLYTRPLISFAEIPPQLIHDCNASVVQPKEPSKILIAKIQPRKARDIER